METPLTQAPATAAVAGQRGQEVMAELTRMTAPALRQTIASAAAGTPLLPILSPGHQSSEFYLALIIVTAIFAALWEGKLEPAPASALLGLIVSGYPSLRTWLKAQHVDAMARVLAAQTGNGSFRAVADTVAGMDGNNAGQDQGEATPRTRSAVLAPLVMLAAMLSCVGCAETPYYVSGINGTIDMSKDGAGITGGGVGVTISPNPYYPLPGARGLRK